MNTQNRIVSILLTGVFLSICFLKTPALGQLRTEVIHDDTLTIYRYESKDKVDINIRIDLSKSDSYYLYQYSVLSQANSDQQVYNLEIDLRSAHEDIVFPSGWFGLGSGSKPGITWAARDSISRIHPGEQQGGFAIKSKGLPSISSFLVKGWTEIPVFDVEPDSFENATVSEDGKKGFTVGPGITPEEVVSDIHIDTLQTFLTRSCTELDWITNRDLCRSLETKLENMERQLEQDNTNAASGSLEAFINEVAAQKDKQLSSEAYTLLYFNGQYLLEQLNQ